MKAFGFTQKLFSYGGHQASALRLHLVALRLTPAVSATPLSQDARAEAAADRATEGLVLSKKKKKFCLGAKPDAIRVCGCFNWDPS